MKVLLFYTHNQGFLSSFFFELSRRLKQEGHEVVNFCWKQIQYEEEKEGVRIIVREKKSYWSNYKYVYNIIRKEKPNIIISNFSYVNPALLFGKLFGVKNNVVWFHSLHEQMESTKLNVFVKKCFLKLADLIIANSELTKDELKSFYKVTNHKIHAIPFWTTISEKQIQPSNLNLKLDGNVLKIGCPGRLVEHKNQRVLLEAASIIKKEIKPFHIYFAGKGDQKELLEKVVELKLSKEVTFLDNLNSNDMLHFYNSVDVVVLPSLHEAFGLVFIEAIALGTPVIVSNRFGALSFISNNSSNEQLEYTFNPNSSKELADKLKMYLNDVGLSRLYFKEICNNNFDKELIFNRIYKLLT